MGFPFSYVLGDDGLQVQLGPWTIRRIRYDDIEEVQPGYALWNEHWCNVWPFRYVTIRRESGWIRNFLVNPPDREGFIQAINVKVGQRFDVS